MSSDRDPLELLADEFIQRCRRGERPSVTQYAEQHPDLADDIRELFPTILSVEYAKDSHLTETGDEPLPSDGVPHRLGDFRIIRELGRGGMGVVYEAEQESLRRIVAVKVLPRFLMTQERRRERFRREARTAARLHHTNIVPVFGVGSQDGFAYFVMQRIHGVGLDALFAELTRLSEASRGERAFVTSTNLVDLARTLLEQQRLDASDATLTNLSDDKRRGIEASGAPVMESPVTAPAAKPATPGEHPGLEVAGRRSSYWFTVARLMAQAASALAYAHEQGVLHRDVKPANLLLDKDGVLWITDFGLAKATEHDNLTEAGDLLGTLRYMAPEQFDGSFDERSDQYSLGITLYEFTTLLPAFGQVERNQLLGAIKESSLTPPRQIVPTLPRDLDTIILKATACEPSRRYPCVADLQADLESFIAGWPIQARRMSSVERAVRWSRRHRALALAISLVASSVITVAAVSIVAYFKVRAANWEKSEALVDVRAQRTRAEKTAELAVEALDNIFEQFAPTRTGATSTYTVDGSGETKIEVPVQPVLAPETASLLEHMLDFYRRLAAQEGAESAIRLKIAEAKRRVGDIHHRLGRLKDAQSAYTQAIQLLEQHEADSGPTPTTRLGIARTYCALGTISIEQEQGQDGRKSLRQARDILEAMRSSPSFSPAVRFELARICYQLAKAPHPPIPTPRRREPGRGRPEEGMPPPPRDAHRPPGRDHRPPGSPRPPHERFEEGVLPWQEAVEILTELSAAFPDVPDYLHLLALCYRETPHLDPPNLDDRPSLFDATERAIHILERLADDFPGVPEYRFDLGETYARFDLKRGTGVSPEIVTQRMQTALRIVEDLVAERPNVPVYVSSLARMHHKLGAVLRRIGREDEMEEAFRRAVTLQSALALRFPEVGPYAVGQAAYQFSLAELLLRRKRLRELRELLESSVTILEGKVCQALGHGYVFDLSERAYRVLSDVLWRLGEHRLANDAAERAEESRRSRQAWRRSPTTHPR